jgi:hypothetical protein
MPASNSSEKWTAVPVLPAISLQETLAFWKVLGFAITYNQKAPYPYGVVERGGTALHFAGGKGLTPQTNPNGCLMMVEDAHTVHADFAARFKAAFGKVPSSGLPRLSRWREGGTRFTVTDTAGNWVIVISRGEKDQKTWEEAEDKTRSPLAQAVAKARRFRDYKQDLRSALGVLDVALKKPGAESDPAFAEASALRAEIAAEREEDSPAS